MTSRYDSNSGVHGLSENRKSPTGPSSLALRPGRTSRAPATGRTTAAAPCRATLAMSRKKTLMAETAIAVARLNTNWTAAIDRDEDAGTG